ncbi:MAG: rhomboid family intramembrane serine protease [Clostridia bacterium]|nr:rhomboid family intramembrane serine protease [Clostridia bacterium]
MQKRKIVFSFNAPLMISFALVALAALLLSRATGGTSDRLVFSVYRSPMSPLFILRLFGHVFGHADFAHYVSNMALILSLGPIVEDRFGSIRVLIMFAITAVVSAIFHLVFGGNTMLMGASGIVFMLIFLASTAGTSHGEIPITLIAVCVLYLTQEILSGVFSPDNVSHLTHIVGGLCGAFMGIFLHK